MNLKQFIKPLIILLLGLGLTILGATFKVLHLQFAPQLLMIGTILEFIAILYAIVILIKISKKK